MLTFIIPLIGLFLFLLFFSDPFIIFLLFAAIYERKLKKMMPSVAVNGELLFEHALIYGDEKEQKTAKRGVLFQWLYAFLWAAFLLFGSVVFLYRKDWVSALVISLIAVPFLYWGMRFFRLWITSRNKAS